MDLPCLLLGASLLLALGAVAGCRGSTAQASKRELAPLDASRFRHRFVARDLPGTRFSALALVDIDRDGRLDVSVGSVNGALTWFRFTGWQDWAPRPVGDMAKSLAGIALDVDGDGAPDLVTGRHWYRNETGAGFSRHEYDPAATYEVHDLVAYDITGDGRLELVALSESAGLAYYDVPAEPARQVWPRHLVSGDPLKWRDRIHGGIAPRGVGDLDGDRDADLVAGKYWYENLDQARRWVRHDLPFCRAPGPFGWSTRSWIADMNGDGAADIVMTDSDQAHARAALLLSNGQRPPKFRVQPLPQVAPGPRGSFHSLVVADFDGDGDLDVFTAEQEDADLQPAGAHPRWYVWENLDGRGRRFIEHVVLDARLGGHDAQAGDIDGDGDLDICAKVWKRWGLNANGGRPHVSCLENLTR